MADVAARREARRRKILENSQNRLKLITGEHNGSISETEIVSSKLQNIDDENKHEPSINNFEDSQNHDNHIHETLIRNFLPSDVDITSLITEKTDENDSQLTDSSTNYVNYLKHSKLYVISLAIIIRLLFIFQMQFCVRDSIFLPFIIFELTMQFYRSNMENVNSVLNTFLLLSNLPPQRVKLILRVMKFVENFTTEFCLYFFTFMILHAILEYFI